MSDVILSIYPLSSATRDRLRDRMSYDASSVTLAQLKLLKPLAMVGTLLRLRPDRLFIVLEDDTSRALLPAMYSIALLARPRKIIEILESDESRDVSWRRAVLSGLTSVRATVEGRRALIRARKDVAALKTEERVEVTRQAGRRGAFLNANLWFGVKAGGSVGHISGVVNALATRGRLTRFISAGGRLMVKPTIAYVELEPPRALGLSLEQSQFRFGQDVARTLLSSFRRDTPDFLYQRMSLANYSGVVVSRKSKIPLIMEYNGSEAWVARNWGRPLKYQKLAEDAEDICLRHAHLIVTISDVLEQELLNRGIPADRIVTYPNCIDPELINPERYSSEDRLALRARHGIATDALVVTFLGTFGQWHGAEILGKAIRILLDQHADVVRDRKLHFLFVGSGAKVPDVRAALGPHVDGSHVTFAGLVPQQDAPLYLSASDIFTSPHVANPDGSRFFGSPTKLFEYLAMERAIAASDLDQIGEILAGSVRVEDVDAQGGAAPDSTDSSVALLTEPGDAEALARGLIYLAQNPEWRASLGRRARALALSKYTWQHHVDAIVAAAQRLELID